MKTITTSTRKIFTPGLDRYTMGAYQGNHRDLIVSFTREGDRITVSQAWGRDIIGTFYHREEQVYSVSEMIAGLAESAGELGFSYVVEDNIPQGRTLAFAI